MKTKIQHFRELRGFTQDQMADKLNVAVSTYGKIERGETNIIHRQLHKIADILGVEVKDLLPDSTINHFENNNIHINVMQTEHYHDNQVSGDMSTLLTMFQSNQVQLIENQKLILQLLQQISISQ